MAIFGLFKKKEVNPWDIDYMANAQKFEQVGDYQGAIGEYEKIINIVYADKPVKTYRHITKKIIECYLKLGNYEKVMELWPLQHDPVDYTPKEMFELIKILEANQRQDLASRVYDSAGNKLLPNKIEFLIKQKKIPEANALLSGMLINLKDTTPGIQNLWMTKVKLCLSLRKWEEANKYLDKILDRNSHNEEARKLKEFCIRQARQ
jgi:tetratricopeptide (TPR) repeat protein